LDEATDMESAISKNLLDVQCSCLWSESAGSICLLPLIKRGTSLLLPTNPSADLKERRTLKDNINGIEN